MAITRPILLLATITALLPLSDQFEPRKRTGGYSSRLRIKELCKDRVFNEYFREKKTDNCAKVSKCDTSRTGLSKLTCSAPLVFDVDIQICNYEDRVNNCDRSERIPECSEVEEGTECREVEIQAKDPSVQVEAEDDLPPECDKEKCVLPACFCSADGTLAPGVAPEEGGLSIDEVPQMILISFNGAVTGQNMALYERLFKTNRVNPNGCSVKGTFFVSHKYTNYSAVTELHRKGHEIAVFSVSNNDQEEYWQKGDYDTWLLEMAGNRQILETFAGIKDQSVVGVRAPYLKVGGDTQFKMMNDTYFPYDASITVPLGRVPVWPYTLDYRIPHTCHGNCPKESWPIWEMPINELDRREDPTFDEELTGCPLVSSCTNIQDTDQFKTLLENNFNRHYSTNRAPLSLSFNPFWLYSNKGFIEVFENWMDSVLARYKDVFFVTNYQALLWITNPTNVNNLGVFEEWKDKCKVEGQPLCSLPNVCPLTTAELPGETIRLHTCGQCPNKYPWLLDPEGAGFSRS